MAMDAIAAGSGADSAELGLDRLFGLLADEDRRVIVRHLAGIAPTGSATISEVAFAAGLSRFSASRHLQVMREAGIVDMRKDGNRVLATLCAEPFLRIDDWLWDVVRTFEGDDASG